MKVLTVIDDENYDPNWKRLKRSAVRAVIVRGERIALVKSRKKGYYKFPGGGIESGETHLQTLCRETLEETGLTIKPDTMREIGLIREIRKSVSDEDTIFDQTSYYYFAEVEDDPDSVSLDEYEAELGYLLEWTDIQSAYETDMELGGNYDSKFILREAFVLGVLLGCVSRPPDFT